MIIRRRVVRNVRTFGARFHISNAFLFSSDERSTSFTYVIPRTGGARNFVYNIALFFFGGAKLWYRKLLLSVLWAGLFNSDFDVMFSRVQIDISLVRCAHSFDLDFNTR